MGITGLIPFLDACTRRVKLDSLRGSAVGIDTYCWLHRGAIGCADKLVRGDPTDQHIQFCLKFVNLLLINHIKPVLVFDGRHLPAKALTERRRRESRHTARDKAKVLLREGKVNEARSYFNRCVDITHEMAHALIKECRKRNVDTIVAPYEADAQLAYLQRQGIVDYVVTEDSDLTLFGCSKILFKLDLNGNGLLFEAEHLYKAMGCKEAKYSFEKFQMMCILSGCDYLDSLKGVGLAKACKFVLMTEETDIGRCLQKLPQYLNLRTVTVDEEYILNFQKALATFKYMIVYDPVARRQCRLNALEDENDIKFCDNAGIELDADLAYQMALGNVHPFTMKTMDHWGPEQLDHNKCKSIWGKCGAKEAGEPQRNIISVLGTRKAATPLEMTMNYEEPNDILNTSEHILNKYLTTSPEPITNDPKKLKMDVRSKVPVGHEVTTSRNPFLKRSLDAAERSPDTSKMSLLSQVSPVKRFTSASMTTQLRDKKLSKFSKTVLGKNNVHVISRFFGKESSANVIAKEEKPNYNDDSCGQGDGKDSAETDDSDCVMTLSQEEREQTPDRIMPLDILEVTIGAPEGESENEVVIPERTSQKENEVIILSETESPKKNKSPVKRKSVQSRLMAFGFQKKGRLKN